MCLLLCANRETYEWLHATTARSMREDPLSQSDKTFVIKMAPRQRASCRSRADGQSTVLSFRMARAECDLANEGHKPFETLAYAWGRLLVLVGWRR
jgi:hypothetical protein